MRFNAQRGPWLWLPLLCGLARPALADDKAASEILFDEGKALLRAGKLAEACPKLAESHRLDPGVGTLLYLGECYERAGKLASAWATWREAGALASQGNQAQRVKLAREHSEALEPKLIRLQIVVPPGSDLPTLSVTRNGASVARPLWGSPVPVDPGPIEVVASAPGRVPWKLAVQGTNPGTVVVSVPPLEAERVAPAASSAPPPVASAAPVVTASAAPRPIAPPPSNETPGSSRKTAALVAGGVGVIGVALGSYFGLNTMSKWSDAKDLCNGGACSPGAHKLSQDASSSGTLSTVFFALGAAGLGAGAFLWFTAPSGQSVGLSPTVGPGLAGLSMRRSF